MARKPLNSAKKARLTSICAAVLLALGVFLFTAPLTADPDPVGRQPAPQGQALTAPGTLPGSDSPLFPLSAAAPIFLAGPVAIKDLIEKRAKLTDEGRKILDKAEAEKRALTDEEKQRWKKATDDALSVTEDIQRYAQQAEAERALAANVLNLATNVVQPGDDPAHPQQRAIALPATRELKPEEAQRLNTAVGEHLRAALGFRGPLADQERRDLQFTVDTAGGYLVPPQEFVASIIKFVNNLVFIRQRATKYTLEKAQTLGIPTLAADPADADWTSELAIGGTDTTMAVGKRELMPHPLAKLLKVSEPLLRMSALDVAGLIMERLGYKFGVTEEKSFLLGNGAQQPLGLFTASADGISTGRDVSTGNTTTTLTFDGLRNAKYGLKGQYWQKAAWIFNRSVLALIANLKDGEGRYLWEQSVQVGQPDRILGFPVNMSEYSPNTMTTGLYAGILGDYSFYWIVDTLNLRIQILRELYAATNQIGFVGRQELDGMPVLEEAFVRVKLA